MFLGVIAVAKGNLVPNMNFVRLGTRELLSIFLCWHGEDIYHSNGHRNGASNKQLLSQLIFVAKINFVQLQMDELLRFSLLPWKQCLP